MKNLGLIGWVIERFSVVLSDVYSFDDAWQDGWIGLVRACQKFDPTRGHQFSTYAVPQIRSAIQKGRGEFEGLNFRRDMRTQEPHISPLSLDFIRPNGPNYEDSVDSGVRVEGEAVGSTVLDEIRRAAEAICKDDVDRIIVALLVDPEYDRTIVSVINELASRLGISRDQAGRRVRSVRSRLAARLAKTDLARSA